VRHQPRTNKNNTAAIAGGVDLNGKCFRADNRLCECVFGVGLLSSSLPLWIVRVNLCWFVLLFEVHCDGKMDP